MRPLLLFALLLPGVRSGATGGRPGSRGHAPISARSASSSRPTRRPNTSSTSSSSRARAIYDGSAFHRVVAYGMIQGGDPLLKNPKTPRNLWGTGGLNQLPAEFSDLKHERGVVSTVSIPGQAG